MKSTIIAVFLSNFGVLYQLVLREGNGAPYHVLFVALDGTDDRGEPIWDKLHTDDVEFMLDHDPHMFGVREGKWFVAEGHELPNLYRPPAPSDVALPTPEDELPY